VGDTVEAAGRVVASGAGPAGEVVFTFASGVCRSIAARLASRKQRRAFVAQLEDRSGVSGLTAAQMPQVLKHETDLARLVTDTELTTLPERVVAPLIPPGLATEQRALVADAFVALYREQADPVLNQTRRLLAAAQAPLDRGIPRDSRIPTLLRVLDDADRLPERDGELAYLTQLVLDDDRIGYEAIVAPAFTGKTTLLAFFAAHPPTDTDVISFFVSKVAARRDTLSVALNELIGQLRYLLDDPGPVPADEAGRLYTFEQLWDRAVQRTRTTHRRLLLIIDGLDEQKDPISSLLPAVVEPHVTVIVGCRPNPRDYILNDPTHPLIDLLADPLRITSTAHTERVHDAARSQLRQALARAGGAQPAHPLAADTLAVLAVTKGADPPTIAALADTTGPEVVTYLHGTSLAVAQEATDGHEVWILAHGTYLDVLEHDHRDIFTRARQRLTTWADKYASHDPPWPDDTPWFLLARYPALLDLPALTELITHTYRRRVRTVLGTEAPIVTAIQDITRRDLANHDVDRSTIDLTHHLCLHLHRLEIAATYRHLPQAALTLLADTWPAQRLLALARELPTGSQAHVLEAVARASPSREILDQICSWDADLDQLGRTRILLAVARADPNRRAELLEQALATSTGLDEVTREQVLLAITQLSGPGPLLNQILRESVRNFHPYRRGRIMAAVANANGPGPLLDQVISIVPLDPANRAAVIAAAARADPSRRAALLQQTLALATATDITPSTRALVLTAAASADPSRRAELLGLALAAATDLNPRWDTPVLMDMLVDIARLSPPGPLLENVLNTTAHLNPFGRERVLVAIAQANGPGPLLEQIIDAAASLDRPFRLEQVLVAVAQANGPGPLLEQIIDAAAHFHPVPRARVLAAAAQADPNRRATLLEQVLATAGELDPSRQAEVLLAVAQADPNRRTIMRDQILGITGNLDPSGRAEVLLAVAQADPDRRTTVLQQVLATTKELDPSERASILTALADASGPGPLLEQILTATSELEGFGRGQVLAAVAGASGPGPLLDHVLAVAGELDPSRRAEVLLAIAQADPGRRTIILDQILATTGELDPSKRAEVLLAIAQADTGRRTIILNQILATTGELDPSKRAGVLCAVAQASGPGPLLEQALAAASELEPILRPRVLLDAAQADPNQRNALLQQVLATALDPALTTAIGDDTSWPQQLCTLTVELCGPGPLLEQVLTATTDFHPLSRARVLLAVAEADPDRRTTLLEQVLAITDQLEPRLQPQVLLAVAQIDPDQRAGLLEQALTAFVDELRRDRLVGSPLGPFEAAELADIALASGASPLLEQILATAAELEPSARARVLGSVAEASGPGPLLDQILAAVTELEQAGRVQVLESVACADPSAKRIANVIASVMADADTFSAPLLSLLAETFPETRDVLVRFLRVEHGAQ
jgi:hypothetical protein